MSQSPDPPNESTARQPFQAEVRQLLDIVIHSLYTDREIFVRELVSNASDALEKLRHLQLTEKEIFDESLPLEIAITTDEDARTVTFEDHGIGMTRDELVENLGTIAHSGSKAFMKALQQSDDARANLIGQFGVGFYSAFMVADHVEVHTRTWRPEGESLVWRSDGESGFEIDEVPGQRRGARIVVHLREDQAEFAKGPRIRGILESYSSFVPFPILLDGERVNKIEALWLKNRSEISDEEYDAFYKFVGHDAEPPRLRLHFTADAPLALHALLFVPGENPERFAMGQVEPGVSLYCRKVLIDDRPEGLLPDWLRFLKGVVDSEDLPLNISRESMQDSALVQKLNRVLTKRLLKRLERLAKDEPDAYLEFWKRFNRFLKEGIATDFSHRDQLAGLLRFESSMTEPGELTGFEEYRSRAPEGQDVVYYQVAANRAAIEGGPYLEAFRARGLEVAFFIDHPIDEYVVSSLPEVGGRRLVAVDRAGIELEELEEPAGAGESLDDDEAKALCEWMRGVLGEKVADVRVGRRLVDSPAAALLPEDSLSPQMRQMMRALDPGKAAPAEAVELEVNPRHEVIRGLERMRGSHSELAGLLAGQVLDNALMSAGLLEDPKDMIGRIYRIMGAAVGAAPGGPVADKGAPEDGGGDA